MDTTFTPTSQEEPAYTGKYLVTFVDPGEGVAKAFLDQQAGMTMASSSDFEGLVPSDLGGAGAVYLADLGIAVVDADPDQTLSISSASEESRGRVVVEPERILHTLNARQDYLKGFRDGLNLALDGDGDQARGGVDAETFHDTTTTWGLQATRANLSAYTGAGIRVAVLDTGIQLSHPAFAGRTIVTQSFIAGQTVSPDVHGHGTHVSGTVTGPRTFHAPTLGFGCAPGAEYCVGKVLDNTGHGSDSQILAGIQWAINLGCRVISMSLGGAASGPGYSTAYEQAASLGLARGSIIVAAAGNDSSRPGLIRPVGYPANSPSVLAVGAVDANLTVASFSNRGIYLPYGAVNIAGPGVNVYSSYPPALYRLLSGTSMATPHVAGIAALWAQASGLRGQALWNLLLSKAKPIPGLSSADVGTGLVQAP